MPILYAYLIIINLYTFLIYGLDKGQAKYRKNPHRTSENFLITLLFIGGWLGGISAMIIFHHKVRKSKFKIARIIAFIWSIACTIIIYYLAN